MSDADAFWQAPGGADDAHVAAVVEQWGEAFRDLAHDPRLGFDGDAIVIRLWKPIAVSGAETAELRMREPDLDDLEKIGAIKNEIAAAKRLLVMTCAITDREAGKVGMRDFMLTSRLLAAFSGAAPATGSSSSRT